ncbi:MAG: hypothetical protein HKN70_05260 [Gammaproteobacteria bacterium]|nr:hypothetical protein [Gammaproteobacteria bacterium]
MSKRRAYRENYYENGRRIVVLLVAVMISGGPVLAKSSASADPVGEFAVFIQDKCGFRFLSDRMTNASKLMLIYGAELGRHRVHAGGRYTTDEFYVPCVSAVCQGSVVWEYQGTDANGNPVRLILEFSSSGG